MTLDASQLATALLDVEPLDMPGHLRVRGTAQVPSLKGERRVEIDAGGDKVESGKGDEAMDIRLNIK